MNRLLLLVVLLAAPARPQDGGWVLERRVKLVLRDPVDKAREIQRVEQVKMQGGNLLIDDLTFGTKLIIRGDKKLVWIADPLAGTMSELTFEQIGKRRAELIAEIVKARQRVAGSDEEKTLTDILAGLGEFAAPPKAEIKTNAKSETVAGRACVGRELVVDGNLQRLDVLVDASLPSAAYFDLMAAIGCYPAPVAEALRSLGGFPLKGTIRYALFMDRVTATEEAVWVKAQAVDAAEFEQPAGLKKVPLAGFEPSDAKKPEKPKDFTRSFKEDDIDRQNNPLKEEPKKDPGKDPK